MATLKDIRKRVQSIKSTRQITRAMKMVAAAKLRRSQEAILNARPYAYRIYSILLNLVKKEEGSHPLLVSKNENKIKLVILAGDRGLCGSFNANIFRESLKFISIKESSGAKISMDCIGKKAFDFFKKKREVSIYHEGLLGKASFQKVSSIGDDILDRYLKDEFDSVYLVYNEFKSAIQQRVVVEKLIPISTDVPEGVVGILRRKEDENLLSYLFEPAIEEILKEIVPRHFKMQLYRAVLESVASEHGARMSAMENATKNASEMMDALTLEYNKARQASITKELMEIVGGVEAMRA